MGRQSLYGTKIVFHFPDIGDKQPRSKRVSTTFGAPDGDQAPVQPPAGDRQRSHKTLQQTITTTATPAPPGFASNNYEICVTTSTL
ncbi:hypothetical protein LSAT2_003835 [Lamellibrachia satsuma]|nr:hypothetical protein LSAT2_003835 [Lamellibrachia satsuma]